MMLLIALIVLFVSLLFLIFDSLRTEQRRKKSPFILAVMLYVRLPVLTAFCSFR